jgi:hypothetical protein
MSPSRHEERPSSVARVVVWTLPLINVVMAVVAQIAVPRLLQLRLSEADYTVYVGLSSVAVYVGLGEGGVQISLLRELAARHGAGDQRGFAAEARRARGIFVVASILGGVLAAFALLSQRATLAPHGSSVLAGATALIVASMLELALASFHTAMLASTGKLLGAQLAGMAMVLVPQTSLVVALVATRSLAASVWAQAAATATLALVRGAHAGVLLRVETRGVDARARAAPLLTVIGPGTLFKLSEVLQTASYPHVLTAMAPSVVPGAVPARTYANATRLVTQQFVNLLQVHVTRGLAGDAHARARAREHYELAATFLTSIHLVQLAGAAGLAGFVFQLWLPNQAPHIGVLLPGVFAWQALLAASLPADILFVAAGRMRTLGVVRLFATLVGLATVALLLRTSGRAALGMGLAVSALPLFAFGLWSELHSLEDVASPRRQTLLRYGLAAFGALGCAGFGSYPWLASLSCGLAGFVGLPRSAARLWRLRKG